jgi:hypothetical protein
MNQKRQATKRLKLVQRGVSGGQFSGLLHFATDRTLSGWELLCRMVKHTSKEFLYGRKHSQIFECREIRSKTGSKTGLKRGPSRCPKHRKHRYTGKSSLQRGLKTESKIHPKRSRKSHHRVRHAGLHGLDAIHNRSAHGTGYQRSKTIGQPRLVKLGSNRGVKMELENTTNRPPNKRSNARAKSHSERWARDRILVRRALA